ncbi:GCN5- N-acetyltransferase [Penicillium waksmanii]|uniref:GCN5- N-acetyltransferase n=1 Tax=Penicillium waksmanii TaxID=69791 RepID=UPI002548445B|nr:GCN5- N-acetyltransferase [Penicillium waksmanii]KAJ5963138.1 GCN5- N-acetyltransferase [Penicillium waksmanii]
MIYCTYERTFRMDNFKFTIRQAEARDAPLLPAVERSAAQAFLQLPKHAWLADGDTQSVEQHLKFIKDGFEWVAVDAKDAPIAFLNGNLTKKTFHIHEVSVQSIHQGKRVGRNLMETVIRWAVTSDCSSVTLTTFRNVPWNEGFYRSLGFRTLDSSELTPELNIIMKHEAEAGLLIDERCAMCLRMD